MAPESEVAVGAAVRAWIAQGPAGVAHNVRVFGLNAFERARRSLERAGVEDVRILREGSRPPVDFEGRGIVVRGDRFYDERLIQGLVASTGVVLFDAPDDEPSEAVAAVGDAASLASLGVPDSATSRARLPSGLRAVTPIDIAPGYNPALRKFDPPFVYRTRLDHVRETENRIFQSSYKGITDLLTKWVLPLPAREATRWLAQRGIKPNSVTAVSYLLVALATLLFASGWFATGLVAAFAMTFLDTVDGKLARCTLSSTRFGGALDHGLDLVHPPLWWIAWGYGLALAGQLPASQIDPSALASSGLASSGLASSGLAGWELVVGIVVGGYVAGRLLEGVFLLAFKQEMFTWRPFDAHFRSVIARRNPNLLLLMAGTAAGRPDLGLIAVAAWTLVCLAVAAVRIGQAFAEKRRGHTIRAWHEEQYAGAGQSYAADPTGKSIAGP